MKIRTEKLESEYKNYKKLFESVKKRSKKLHFSRIILKYQSNIKKTWDVIKDAIGKNKSTQSRFLMKIIHKTKTITGVHLIAYHFNSYFREIGPNLANKIEKSSINFEGYIKKCNSIQPEHPLSIKELKDAFFWPGINKSPGFDGISFTVLKNCFGALHKPLLHVFNLSIVKGIFPDDIKIARVNLVFKGDDEKDLENYRPISVLPCFSKILERIDFIII